MAIMFNYPHIPPPLHQPHTSPKLQKRHAEHSEVSKMVQKTYLQKLIKKWLNKWPKTDQTMSLFQPEKLVAFVWDEGTLGKIDRQSG